MMPLPLVVLLVLVVQLVAIMTHCEAFSPAPLLAIRKPFARAFAAAGSSQKLAALPPSLGPLAEGALVSATSTSFPSFMPATHSSSMELSAGTLDLASILSDLWSGLLGLLGLRDAMALSAGMVVAFLTFIIVSQNSESNDDE
jgi:hypothetical protein